MFKIKKKRRQAQKIESFNQEIYLASEKEPLPMVLISPEVFRTIRQKSVLAGQCETGGLLLGSRQSVKGEKSFIINLATGPGKRAKHSISSFIPDVEYYKKEMKFFLYQHGLIYLGEWHKHPGQLHVPSCTDLETMKQITLEQDLQDILVGISTTLDFNGSTDSKKIVDINFYHYSNGYDDFKRIQPRVLSESLRVKGRHEVSSVILDSDTVVDFINGCDERQVIKGSINENKVANFISESAKGENILGELMLAKSEDIEISIPEIQSELIITVFNNDKDFSLSCWRVDSNNGQTIEVPIELIDIRKNLFKRLDGLGIENVLSNKTVALIGVGSVGSMAAMQMAKAGVKSIVLVDPDKLEMHNVIRHLCDLRDLGRNKVNAVADRIRHVNPEVSISVHSKDVITNYEEIMHDVSDVDILLVSTDTPDSRRLSNTISVEMGIPTIYISLYERARTGSVQRVVPGLTACRACIGDPKAEFIPGKTDYTNVSERDILFQPGLDADISLMTMLGVKMAISTLLNPTDSVSPEFNSNYLYWNGYPEASETHLLFVSETGMKRNRQCEICYCNQIVPNPLFFTEQGEIHTEEIN
jgi:molybdopterin/thiamine biosynthesis adenylyltransferase/proteasome lid subunit RPN8/RPN11